LKCSLQVNMKLLARYQKINFLVTIVIFGLAAISLVILLRIVIVHQFDENLRIEKEVIENYASKHRKLPEIIQARDKLLKYTPSYSYERTKLRTYHGFDPIENESNDFREIVFSIRPNGKEWYRISVAESIEGTEAMIKLIALINITTIILLLVVNIIINKKILTRLWHPFYEALDIINKFKIGYATRFSFAETDIEEFSKLNAGLDVVLNRAKNDFRILKEFTENASHEMQTPLAIVRSKLDLIIQEESASRLDEDNVDAIYKAIDRLSRLNRSLLLLTKIENNQFNTISEISLDKRIDDKLLQFQEMLRENHINIKKEILPVMISMDSDLIDILLNNLLSNAVKHNIEGGSIWIRLNAGRALTILNTSASGRLDESRIFDRFYKNRSDTGQTGLGLSILKQISLSAGFTLSYRFIEGLHSFRVQW
jgi:signal transduction histidine kinase